MKRAVVTRSHAAYQFVHGKCQIFALVLHAELGLPIVDFFYQKRIKRNFVHTAVMLAPNLFIDVRGRLTMAQMQRYWGDDRFPETTLKMSVRGRRSQRERLCRWSRHKDFISTLAKAHRIFRRGHNTKYRTTIR